MGPFSVPFKTPPLGPNISCCVAKALNACIAIDSTACLVAGEIFGLVLIVAIVCPIATCWAGSAISLLRS